MAHCIAAGVARGTLVVSKQVSPEWRERTLECLAAATRTRLSSALYLAISICFSSEPAIRTGEITHCDCLSPFDDSALFKKNLESPDINVRRFLLSSETVPHNGVAPGLSRFDVK